MTERKPVILLIDNSVAFTGAFKCALQQAELMRPQYEYVFVLPKSSKVIRFVEERGFRVYVLPMLEIRKDIGVLFQYFPQLLLNGRRLKKIIYKEHAHLIVLNDFYNLLGVVMRITNVPVKLITYVRFLPSAIPGPLRKLWTTLALKYADKLIAVSDAVKMQLPACTKVVKVYDAIEASEKLPEKQINTSAQCFRLLYLSNYIPGKGHNHALTAFFEAYHQNPKLQLTFIGGDMGLAKNKKYKETLEAEVQRKGLSNSVRFMPFEKDIERAMKEADAFLNFSESESFSMTCAEAAIWGIPTIASRCGGPEDIIVHGETGLLVENRNVKQMAEAILLLANDPELCQKLSLGSKLYARKKFSSEKFQIEMKKVITEVLEAN